MTTTSKEIHKKKDSSVKKVVKRTVDIILTVVLLAVILLAVYIFQNKKTSGQVEIGGYQMYVVLSGSMSPTFDTGSIVVIRKTDPKNLVVGDVVTFMGATETGKTITHRVIEISTENGLSFTTKGDANNVADSMPLDPENVIGKVQFSVPYIGYLLEFSKTKTGLYLLIVLPSMIIFLLEIWKIIGYFGEKKRTARNPQERVLEIEQRAAKRTKSVEKEMPMSIMEESIRNEEPATDIMEKFIRKGMQRENTNLRITKDEEWNQSIPAANAPVRNNVPAAAAMPAEINIPRTSGQQVSKDTSDIDNPEKNAVELVAEAQNKTTREIYQYTIQAEKTRKDLQDKLDAKRQEEEDLDRSIQRIKTELLGKLNSYENRKENS